MQIQVEAGTGNINFNETYKKVYKRYCGNVQEVKRSSKGTTHKI